jgi:hypothetical protein
MSAQPPYMLQRMQILKNKMEKKKENSRSPARPKATGTTPVQNLTPLNTALS